MSGKTLFSRQVVTVCQSNIGNPIQSLKAKGAISVFAVLFTAFGTFFSNPTIESVETFIQIVAVLVIMVGISVGVWNMLEQP